MRVQGRREGNKGQPFKKRRTNGGRPHIPFATVARVDVLVSWNFKHIVNLKRIHAYNAVNLKRGYPLLEIRIPREAPGED
jgi:hypothetical protein